MSYKITRAGKEYEFENQAKYEEFYNQAKEKARENNLSTAQAFNVLYTPYVAPNNAETPSTPTTNYSSLIDNADAYKNSAYANAESLKKASYEQALKAREEAEALAEIQRKRGVVDASTMAAQEKATYGANAESLGRMGLNVSGYSDYINSQAYASGMAARQNANAQATEAKRQASYQEALARLEADKVNASAKAEADKTYYGMLNEIESAKIADAQAQEQQKQTNYQNFLASIDGETTPEMIDILAKYNGVTDASEIKSAKEYAAELKTANGTTETKVDEDVIANVFSHQEGEGTVENSKNEAYEKYKEAESQAQKEEITPETFRVIEATYKMEYENPEGKYLNVYSKTYDENSFGSYATGKEQKALIEDIVMMVNGNKNTSRNRPLEEGDVVLTNYGNGSPMKSAWKYDGKGGFVKVTAREASEAASNGKLVLPEGYEFDANGRIRYKK